MPLATGMGAKTLCSCVWVGDRAVDNVVKNELNIYPLSLVSYGVDRQDSSATASFLGMFKRTAQFRPGLGCLLNVPVQYVSGSGEYRVTPPADSILSNPWPVGNVVKKRFPEEIDSVRMKEIVKKAFEDKTGLRQMRTILVVYDGQIIIEEYREGFGPESKQMGWSMSKSILNGLIGMAVKNELISLDESSLFPDWTDVRAKITVDHLITQSSGLKWQEDYSNRSAVTEMLFESPDMAAYAMDRALLTPPPGKYFWYSSGNSNLLSDLLKQRIGEKEYLPFIYEDFLHKIGMYNTVIETDASGTFVGASYTYATARVWARFGWLYGQGGAWK
ncbi:MAG: serine hydrolase, partial [Pseudomonadales bacterium]